MDEITRTETAIRELAQLLKTNREHAIKLIRKINNEKRGTIPVTTGPRRVAEVIDLVNRHGWKLREFSERKIPLLELPHDLEILVRAGKLQPTKALWLARILDEDQRTDFTFTVLAGKLSVAQIKVKIEGKTSGKKTSLEQQELDQVAKALEHKLMTRVIVKKNQVILYYHDRESLDAILDRFELEF